jgi:hypothetical protein
MAQAAGYNFNPETVSGDSVRDLAGYCLHGRILDRQPSSSGSTATA